MNNIFIEEGIDRKVFLPMLRDWFVDEFNKMPSKKFKETALFACPIWGEKYINRFFDICLPSLMAPGNLPCLGGVVLMIHTDLAGRKLMADRLRKIEHIKVIFKIIPNAIMKEQSNRALNKFWLLGACQNYYLQYAKKNGLGFHMLMPDHVYSDEFFYRVGKLTEKHAVIIQSSISGSLDLCKKELKQYRKGNKLIIDAKNLVDIAYRNLHNVMRGGLLNGRDYLNDISRSHILLWRGKKEVRVYCPHASILWISAGIIKHLPLRLFSALDTQLPYLFPRGIPFYIPTPEDNLAYVELSDDAKPGNSKATHFDEFACRYWIASNGNDGYLDYFREPHRFAVSHDSQGMTPRSIDLAMGSIIQKLIEGKKKKYTIERVA